MGGASRVAGCASMLGYCSYGPKLQCVAQERTHMAACILALYSCRAKPDLHMPSTTCRYTWLISESVSKHTRARVQGQMDAKHPGR